VPKSAETEVACAAAEEGLGSCMGTYVILCTAAKLRAFDCTRIAPAASCRDDGSTVACRE
jgi:hypothetical protein